MGKGAESPLKALRAVLTALSTIPANADPYPADLPAAITERLQAAVKEIRDWDLSRDGVDREDVPGLAGLVDKALEPLQRIVMEWDDHGVLYVTDSRRPIFRLYRDLRGLRARCYVAERLRAYRRETGLSLRNLSNNAGLTDAYLGQIERCATGLPSVERAQLLLDELGIPLWRQGTPEPPRVRSASEDDQHDRYLALKALRRHTERLPTAAVRHLAATAKSLRKMVAE